VIKACEESLKRLKVKYIDLYLIHWPNPQIPIKETVSALEKLVADGKIKYIGVIIIYGQLIQEKHHQ
jgi:aryl-alcohol dehydrogenase-like predicted oxidoreductase